VSEWLPWNGESTEPPSDWDGGQVMLRSGRPGFPGYWNHREDAPQGDIVAYRAGKRRMAVAWQGIESAPKDGGRILLWTDTKAGDESMHRYVEGTGGEHIACAQIGFWAEANDSPMCKQPAQWVLQWIGEPTHWQPLPDAPNG
jgi:hypothetical protein